MFLVQDDIAIAVELIAAQFLPCEQVIARVHNKIIAVDRMPGSDGGIVGPQAVVDGADAGTGDDENGEGRRRCPADRRSRAAVPRPRGVQPWP